MVPPKAISNGPNSLGKADNEEIPNSDLLEFSPDARKEDKIDPV